MVTNHIAYLLQLFIRVCYLLLAPTLGALLLGALIFFSGATEDLKAIHWIMLSPVLYFAWLIFFLSCAAIEIQVLACLYKKPARMVYEYSDTSLAQIDILLLSAYYQNFFRTWSFPLCTALLRIPYLRELVLLSYAPSVSIGRDVILFGYIYDPDLVQIGNGAVLGGWCEINAHSFDSQPDGSFLYAHFPVTIGARAVIGAKARIDMGATIGADAVVEPSSYVPALTNIPDGEVWGGNPAVFRRTRTKTRQPKIGSVQSKPTSENDYTLSNQQVDEVARILVAEAFDLPLESVTGEISIHTCEVWDSLGQLQIASALHDRFGIQIKAEKIFQIQDLEIVKQLINTKSSRQPIDHQPIDIPENPEWLPLLDYQKATQALATYYQGKRGSNSQGGAVSVVVASTYTAQPIATSLKLWSRAFGITVNVDFFGFNQVYQALLDEQSPFATNNFGVNVILVRLEDFQCESYENFLEHLEQLLSAIHQFTRRTGRRLVVSTLPQPVSSFRHKAQGWVGLARAIWQKRLSESQDIELLDIAAVVDNIGLSSAVSNENDVWAKIPYSARVFQDIGIELARQIRSQRRPPAKVLALDCDGTLWGGAVADVGLPGIHLSDDGEGRGYKKFQEYVLHLQQQGVLLILSSRNDESSVWEVFDQHPDMVLKKEHFAASRINWNPKSQNLRDMASQLNLSSSSFVFVDNDPVMQLEVNSNAPEVNVVPMPVDPALYAETLAKLWIFDSAQVTPEDQQRTQLMQQEEQRQNQQQSATSLKEYLQDLQLIVEMRFATEQDLPRVAQLTQKTNAFNLSLRRRSLDEIKSMKNAGFSILALNAKDRFGDYGLIGLCIYRQDDHQIDSYEIDTFLLSCRALGRGVEESFLFGISKLLRDHGAKNLIAPFTIGPRNQPVRDFFHANGFVALSNETIVAETNRAFELPEYVTWQSTCSAQ